MPRRRGAPLLPTTRASGRRCCAEAEVEVEAAEKRKKDPLWPLSSSSGATSSRSCGGRGEPGERLLSWRERKGRQGGRKGWKGESERRGQRKAFETLPFVSPFLSLFVLHFASPCIDQISTQSLMHRSRNRAQKRKRTHRRSARFDASSSSPSQIAREPFSKLLLLLLLLLPLLLLPLWRRRACTHCVKRRAEIRGRELL